MKRPLLATAPLLLLGLSACAGGYYGGDFAYNDAYPYDGWYDGYYGPIYDGYWGSDNVFYYRRGDHDRHFHRGDNNHFARGPNAPGRNFTAMQGSFRPNRSFHMPNFPHRAGR